MIEPDEIPADETEPFWVPEPEAPEVDDEPGSTNDFLPGAENAPPFVIPLPPDLASDFEADADGAPLPDPATVGGDRLRNSFEAFPAIVVKTYYDSTHPTLGTVHGIDLVRADIAWAATTNIPTATAAPNYASSPRPTVFAAEPFPLRQDQPKYHVAEADGVTAIVTDDGKCFYWSDEEPFVGVVQEVGDVYEATTGGLGNYYLKVRRVQLLTDPTAGGFVWADSAFSGTYTDLVYTKVLVLCSPGQHHGYRVNDKVLVTRKGLYFMASPRQCQFLAYLTNAGPTSQADLTGYHYWCVACSLDAEYAAATDDNWDWSTVTNLFTTTNRWVDAVNLPEINMAVGDRHKLATNGTVYVVVSMFANAAGGDHDKQPYYTFERVDPSTAVKDSVCINATYSPLYPTGNPDPAFSAITAINASTGAAFTDAGSIYATGWSYLDGNGKYNPVVLFKLASTNFSSATFTNQDGTSSVFCTSALSITPTTGVSAEPVEGAWPAGTFRVDGVMFRETVSPYLWNPRIFINPTLMFCIDTSYSGMTELTATPYYYVKAHMFQDSGDGNKINPWFGLPITSDSTWIQLSVVEGALSIGHVGPGASTLEYIAGTGGVLGIRTDDKGHVTEVKDGTGWHSLGAIPP